MDPTDQTAIALGVASERCSAGGRNTTGCIPLAGGAGVLRLQIDVPHVPVWFEWGCFELLLRGNIVVRTKNGL